MEQKIENNNLKKSEEDLDSFMVLLMTYAEQIFGKDEITTFLSGNLNIQQLKESLQNDTRKKIYFESLKSSASEQYKNLASISTIASTLLIIATFNDRIFPYSTTIKILLTILLIIIVLSLVGFYKNYNDAQCQAFKEIEKIAKKQQEQNALLALKQAKDTSRKRLLSYIPLIVNVLVISVICVILVLIWK